MARTKKVAVAEEEVIPQEVIKEPQGIAELSLSFGQQDLNTLKDKVNEIVRFLNK